MLKRVLLGLMACLAIFALTGEASGGAITVHFSAYDYTQAAPMPCDPVYKPYCSPMSQVTANSYFNTTMISAGKLYHYPVSDASCACGERASIGPAAGQSIGVLCYRGIWDKVDARLTLSTGWEAGTANWIGYVPDSIVNLSYSQRMSYVPPC